MMPPDEPGPLPVFEMMHAYKVTSVLRAGVELGVFDLLAQGPLDGSSVASALGLHPRGSRLLLNAIAAVGLAEQDSDGGFRLTPLADTFLVRNKPGYTGDMAKVIASSWEWEAMDRLADAVRKGGPVVGEHAETPEFGYWRDFAAYAHAIAGPTAAKLAEVLQPFYSKRAVVTALDMACGHGLYGYTLASRAGHARIWSLDWPNVIDVALGHARRLGVADRVTGLRGDMFEIDLGGPYDIVLITNVLHHFSAEKAEELLRRAAGVTVPGGKIAVVGFVGDDGPPQASRQAHMFALLMLVWTMHGEVHMTEDYQRMLAAAGYQDFMTYAVPGLPMRIMTGTKGPDDE
jgi:C-methyltransferase